MDDYLFTYGVKYDTDQIAVIADNYKEFVCEISGERHLAAFTEHREYIFVTLDDGKSWVFDHIWNRYGLMEKNYIEPPDALPT